MLLIFDEMKHRRLTPSVETFNILLNAHAKKNQRELLTKCHALMKYYNIPPDRMTYNALIVGYGRSADFKKMTEYFNEMIQSGIQVIL
jgi:pentatricopeptide repeat protein